MVHALRQIWRALTPGGLLLDLRPIVADYAVEVAAGDRVELAGRIDASPGLADDQAASSAIGQAAREGWFEQERGESFDFLWIWDDLQEMISYIEEVEADWLHLSLDVRRNAARLMAEMGAPQVRVRLNLLIGRYRKHNVP